MVFCAKCGTEIPAGAAFCPSCGAPVQAGAAAATPTGAPSGPGATVFIMTTINSAIALVKNPVSFITTNKDVPSTPKSIMLNYVAVLAAIPFFATLIGDLWYYDLFLPFGFSGSFAVYAFASAILVYILDVVAVYVIAIVIRMLAPSFSSTADEVKSLNLASYIYTPVFLIAILDIFPPLGFLTFIGVLYGLYVLYLGLPIVLGTPKERVVTYLVAVVIATIIVSVVIGVIIGVITSAIFLARFGYFY